MIACGLGLDSVFWPIHLDPNFQLGLLEDTVLENPSISS